MHEILYSLWLFLPAGIANMVPTIVWKLPLLRSWNAPVDNGREFRGIRVLGKNKTWRGMVCGVIVAGLAFYGQQQIMHEFGSFSAYLESVSYHTLPLWFGALMGFGALFGDLVESFIKRQKRIPSGSSWFPFDQLDYIIGACLITLPFYVADPIIYVLIACNWFALHLLFSFLGYLLKFKSTPL